MRKCFISEDRATCICCWIHGNWAPIYYGDLGLHQIICEVSHLFASWDATQESTVSVNRHMHKMKVLILREFWPQANNSNVLKHAGISKKQNILWQIIYFQTICILSVTRSSCFSSFALAPSLWRGTDSFRTRQVQPLQSQSGTKCFVIHKDSDLRRTDFSSINHRPDIQRLLHLARTLYPTAARPKLGMHREAFGWR
jgi:hypothetical protein